MKKRILSLALVLVLCLSLIPHVLAAEGLEHFKKVKTYQPGTFSDVEEGVRRRCGFIAPISCYPGEMEQEALALPALKALRGELKPLEYSGRNVWPGFADIGL